MPKNSLPTNANICEIDGAYYPVKLDWLPRVRDLIDLFSFLDQATNHPSQHYYEVVQVVHHMYDITEDISESHKGQHFVSVYVKPSQSQFLKK